MKEIREIIKERRSIRAYEEKPVTEQAIARILEAARWAPSALNHQPLRYIVVSDGNLIRDLSMRTIARAGKVIRWLPLLRLFIKTLRDAKLVDVMRERAASTSGDPIFYRAPLLVLAVADRKEHHAETDLGYAAENMLLEATAMGLGSCVIGFASLLNMDRQAGKILGIPRGSRILAGIVFGYPKSHPAPPQRREDCLINRIGQ